MYTTSIMFKLLYILLRIITCTTVVVVVWVLPERVFIIIT